MALKLDTDKPLFLGKTPVREETTFGHIRKAVHELDKGEGVSYADLEKHLLENFKPAKSENYGASYIKSYVRDAVNKFGHLSHENLGAAYEVVKLPEKTPTESAPKPLTKAQKSRLDVLAFIRDKGEVADQSEVDSTKITAETIVGETKKKAKTIDTMVADLEKDGFVRTEVVEGGEGKSETYIFLTATGLTYVNEHAPVVDGDDAEATDAPADDANAEAEAEEDNGEA